MSNHQDSERRSSPVAKCHRQTASRFSGGIASLIRVFSLLIQAPNWSYRNRNVDFFILKFFNHNSSFQVDTVLSQKQFPVRPGSTQNRLSEFKLRRNTSRKNTRKDSRTRLRRDIIILSRSRFDFRLLEKVRHCSKNL